MRMPRVARAQPELAPPATARRRAEVEWLRVVGMLLVFAIHAAEPFNPWDTWHIVSPARSKWLGELVLFLAPWIMPLFMALAGEGAWYALGKRSGRVYLRERFVRIGLPLVLGILLLVPPQVYLERRLTGAFSGSFLAFYPHFFEGTYPQGNFSWHHLWFLLFLLAFAVVTLPLFEWLRTPGGRSVLARLAAPADRALGLVWLVLPAAAIRAAVPLTAPGVVDIAYDWSDRILLLPAFVFGFTVAAEPALQRAIDRHWRTALGCAALFSACVLVWAWPGHVLDRLPPARSLRAALLWSAYGAAAWCWLVAILGLARRHLTRRSEVLSRASEMAYPFYVLHHPVVVAVAYVVVQRGLGVVPAFGTIAVVALPATVALCAVAMAFDPLRVLFGLRRRA